MNGDLKRKCKCGSKQSKYSAFWLLVVFNFLSLAISICISASVLAAETADKGQTAQEKEAAIAEVQDLSMQIQLLMNQNKVVEAEKVARHALELARSIENEKEELALALCNLSTILEIQGRFGEAFPIMEEALNIQKSLGVESLLLAQYQSHLAGLIKYQGDFFRAEKLLKSALEMKKKLSGAKNASVIDDLVKLADLEDLAGDRIDSLKLYQEAITLSESLNGKDSLETADILQRYASTLLNSDRLTEARSVLDRCFKLRQKTAKEDPSSYADILTSLAMLSYRNQDYAAAKAQYSEAISLYEKHCGQDHIFLAEPLGTLGYIESKLGNMEAARRNCLKAAKIMHNHIFAMLPNLPLSGQEIFLDYKLNDELSLLLNLFQDDPGLASAYDLIYSWKGLLIEALRRESLVNRLSADEHLNEKVLRLKELRSALAANYVSALTSDPQEWQKKNSQLSAEKDLVQKELEKELAGLQLHDCLTEAKVQDLCSQLEEDTALVDIYLYNYTGKKYKEGRRYCAIVSQQASPPRFIDLGAAADLDSLLAKWISEVRKRMMAEDSFSDLQDELWKPIRDSLSQNIKTVWLLPDAELFSCPWHLFPDQEKLVYVKQADSAREVFMLRNKHNSKRTALAHSEEKSKLLLAGGIDFDAGGNEAIGKEPNESEDGPLHMNFLPGSLKEVNGLTKLAESQDFLISELTGADATKKKVMDGLERADYTHLATHGIFLSPDIVKKVRSQGENTPRPGDRRDIVVRSKNKAIGDDIPFDKNPLAQSAIALAGANCFDTKSNEYKGMLSAEEIIGLDLSKCKHITLSACETGLGKEVRSQGVLGLRAAIMASGAEGLLISLWKVPDEATMELMKQFYTNLWVKKLGKVQALRNAQMTLKNSEYGRYKEPVSWAAWILVGE